MSIDDELRWEYRDTSMDDGFGWEGIGAHGNRLNDIHEDLAAYSLQGN
jgi:hypothetical protein